MRVRLLKTVLDERGVSYEPGWELEAEWRDGRMWATYAPYLPLQWTEWELVVPDTIPEDRIAGGG